MLSLMSGSRLELFARGAEIARASRLLSHHEKSPAVRRGLEARYLPRRGSFRPPTAFCTFPAALSDFPSVSSFASPVTLPATSLMAPLACLAEPSIRSLSMYMPFDGVRAPDQLRPRHEVHFSRAGRPYEHAHFRVPRPARVIGSTPWRSVVCGECGRSTWSRNWSVTRAISALTLRQYENALSQIKKGIGVSV